MNYMPSALMNGAVAEASEECEALIAEALQLVTDNPHAANVRLLSFASTAAAQAHEHRGDMEKAAAELRRATVLMFEIEKLQREDAEVQLDLADCLRALAFLEKKRGRNEEAIDALGAAELCMKLGCLSLGASASLNQSPELSLLFDGQSEGVHRRPCVSRRVSRWKNSVPHCAAPCRDSIRRKP